MLTIVQDECRRKAIDLSDDALYRPALGPVQADDDVVTHEGIGHGGYDAHCKCWWPDDFMLPLPDGPRRVGFGHGWPEHVTEVQIHPRVDTDRSTCNQLMF
jgi:hypothetical protein